MGIVRRQKGAIMKPIFKVWYHPYKNPDGVDSVMSYATTVMKAKAFARAFGEPFKVEAL